MKHVLRFSVLAAVMFTSMPGRAMAADIGGLDSSSGIKTYIGMGLGVYDLRFSAAGLNQSNNVFGGMVRLGADFNDYLGAELRVGGSDQKAQVYYSIGNVNYGFKQRANYLFSYLLKLQYPVTQEFRVYGLVGGTTGEVSFQGAQQYAGKVATGTSYGAGFDYSVDDFMSVGLEYMSYWNGVSVNKLAGVPPAEENVDSYMATLRIMM